ncbi:MAG: TfoX/Sxy family protein [Candidatus Omnitrophica bacterium]|nr:TfoX/Sxy family protein [Candidatus Omnitrophota bacterium]
MAYDEALAARVRRLLARRPALVERRMFGGIAFMVRGHMCCGVLKNDLVVRVGPARYEKALSQPHVRPMDFTGRPISGFVFVGPGGYRTDEMFRTWIKQAVAFISSLPPK